MDEPHNSLLPPTDRAETALDAASIVASVVPWVGGPVAAVLTGVSTARKMERVGDVLREMSRQIEDVRDEASKRYVRSEDFEDLLEKTLRKAADERSEAKRRTYAAFLANSIKLPSESYDEKLRILRTLDEVQPDHLRLLHALLQPPDLSAAAHGISGSARQTLSRRVPDIPLDRMRELAGQLADMRLTEAISLTTMTTARGAEDLRGTVTPYGRAFIRYLMGAAIVKYCAVRSYEPLPPTGDASKALIHYGIADEIPGAESAPDLTVIAILHRDPSRDAALANQADKGRIVGAYVQGQLKKAVASGGKLPHELVITRDDQLTVDVGSLDFEFGQWRQILVAK